MAASVGKSFKLKRNYISLKLIRDYKGKEVIDRWAMVF